MIQKFTSLIKVTAFGMLACLSVQISFAQLPQTQLLSVFPAGGKIGETFEVKVTDGVDLDDLSSLEFSHPGITATLKKRKEDSYSLSGDRNFQVTIDPSVPPGIYDVRVQGVFGLSNPRSFVVSSFKESFEKEPNDFPAKANSLEINSTVNGVFDKTSDVDHYSFEGKKGQSIILECHAFRIDSPVIAVLQVFSPEGRRLLNSRDNIKGDPLASLVLPSDGKYTVKLFDLSFRGSKQCNYRLTIHDKPHIDFIIPPSGVAGSTATYTLYGRNLPGGEATKYGIDSSQLQKVDIEITLPPINENFSFSKQMLLPHQVGVKSHSYTWDSPNGASNPIGIFYSKSKPTIEEEGAEPKINLPAEFVGHFAAKNDVDSFRFNAKAKVRYSIDVFGHRLGSPTDPFLLVEQVLKGGDGKESFKRITYKGETPTDSSIGGLFFNTQSDDPSYLMTASADGEYRVSVRDLYFESFGDPRAIYRVVVQEAEPDFDLVALPMISNAPNKGALPSSVVLRKGSSAKILVMINRKFGFNKPVEISVEDLPEGVYSTGTVIGSKEKSATIVIESKPDAAQWNGDIQVTGKVKADEKNPKSSEQIAQSATVLRPTVNLRTPADSRYSHGLKLSVLDEVASFQVVNNRTRIEIRQGEKAKIPLKIKKRKKFDDKIAISLDGVPRNSKIKVQNTNVPKGKEKVALDVVVDKATPVGVYALNLETSASVNYQRNSNAKIRAERQVNQFVQNLKDLAKQEAELLASKKDPDVAKQKEAQKKYQALQDKKKKLQEKKKLADKFLDSVKKSSAPKKRNVYANAASVVLDVKPLPFEANISVAAGGVLKSGSSINVTFKLKRLNRFSGPVTVEFINAETTKGISAEPSVIPGDKSEGSVVVKAGKVEAGQSIKCVARLRADFQGEYKTEIPFSLKIAK